MHARAPVSSALLRRLAATAVWAVVVASLVGCGGAAEDDAEDDPGRRPNFVIIFADDLGYGDLSIYGHPTVHTPRLDRMAQEGVKLTAFYAAAPLCTPSRAALLTGRYPVRNLPDNLGPDSPGGLAPEEVTIAEALKERGYRTAAFGKWHLGSVDGYLPTDQGFDEYLGLLYSNDMIPPWVQTDRPLQLYRDGSPVEEPLDQQTLTERYTEEAVRFIRESGDEPFFLYLPHSMPHVPLHASSQFRGRSDGGLYGDVIASIDWSVGRILDTLEDEGLTETTFVFFTSDNGPWKHMPDRMFSEDRVKPWDAGTAGPLRGWKGQTYEGGMRVPAIAYWPGRIPAGQLTSELGMTIDLFPTLLFLSGQRPDTTRTLDGRNLWTTIRGSTPSPHEYLYYHRGRRLEAVRDDEWKLRLADEGPQLFNLTFDPYEEYDLADRYPAEVARLQRRMAAFARETGAKWEAPAD